MTPAAAAAAAVAGAVSNNMHIPTPDGGIEHTAATFLYPVEWLRRCLAREIVMFPPQFFLLNLLSGFLAPLPPRTPPSSHTQDSDRAILQRQRDRLMEFVQGDGDPPWGEKCISPDSIKLDGRKGLILGLAKPGPELEGTGRMGDKERVIRVELDGEMERERQRPQPKEILWKRDLESGKL